MDMKKVLFAAVFAAASSAAFAQSNINKGDWMVGGNAGFSSEKYDEDKTTTINVSPNIGYFFINNLAGGLRLGLGSTKYDDGTDEVTNSSYHVGPFVRYYFLPSTQKVNIFADGSFLFGQNKSEYGNIETKYKFTQFGIMAGPAIFLTPSTALEFGLGFSSNKVKDAKESTTNFGLSIGFQVHLPGGGATKK